MLLLVGSVLIVELRINFMVPFGRACRLDESSLCDEFFCMLYPLPFAVFLDKVLDFALDSLKLSLGG